MHIVFILVNISNFIIVVGLHVGSHWGYCITLHCIVHST